MRTTDFLTKIRDELIAEDVKDVVFYNDTTPNTETWAMLMLDKVVSDPGSDYDPSTAAQLQFIVDIWFAKTIDYFTAINKVEAIARRLRSENLTWVSYVGMPDQVGRRRSYHFELTLKASNPIR